MSSFFSSAETAMLTIDRYRLNTRLRSGHRGALRVRFLLRRKDRLLGLILIGNNIANIGASIIATILSLRLLGDTGPAIAGVFLTIYLLIFAEITPKTLAAFYPEKIAYPASAILMPLAWLLSPIVKALNYVSNIMLLPFGVDPEKMQNEGFLDRNTLLDALESKDNTLPQNYREMLRNILYMEDIKINEIMIPRSEIPNFNITQLVANKLKPTFLAEEHNIALVYQNNPDDIVGTLNAEQITFLQNTHHNARQIRSILQKIHFTLEHTSLLSQVTWFQKNNIDIALVVDEYGITKGMISTQLIWNKILSGNDTEKTEGIYQQGKNFIIADGTANLRDINRLLQWNLPIRKTISTLNGLILEHLEHLPEAKMSVRLDKYIITIHSLSDNGLVARARIDLAKKDQE